jgi:hypothetical protein
VGSGIRSGSSAPGRQTPNALRPGSTSQRGHRRVDTRHRPLWVWSPGAAVGRKVAPRSPDPRTLSGHERGTLSPAPAAADHTNTNESSPAARAIPAGGVGEPDRGVGGPFFGGRARGTGAPARPVRVIEETATARARFRAPAFPRFRELHRPWRLDRGVCNGDHRRESGPARRAVGVGCRAMDSDADASSEDLHSDRRSGVSPDTVRSYRYQLTPAEDVIVPRLGRGRSRRSTGSRPEYGSDARSGSTCCGCCRSAFSADHRDRGRQGSAR